MNGSVKIYYTSDVHGHVFPVDYAGGVPMACGILNLARDMVKDGNTLILDGGDTLQGTPFSQYYLEHPGVLSCHPLAAAFNAAGYDYVTLGNHDFNFGYGALRDYLGDLHAQCLCANVKDLKGGLSILPEVVHTLENGLRIGITGIVTDFVNVWEQEENLAGLRITDAFAAAAQAYNRLRPLCDMCVCIYHGGFERDLENGRLLSDTGENIGWKLSSELGYDIVLTGHQHMAVEGIDIEGTHAVQCPSGASQYVRLDATVRGGKVAVESHLLPVGETHDPEPYNTLLPLEKTVQHWLDLPVGSIAASIPGKGKLDVALHGSRVASLFNQVQLEATGADISCTSLGNDPVGLATPVTMRGICSAYLFANTLVVLEVDEAVLRESLERCASYFTLEDGEPVISQEFLKPKVEHYNYDFYAGISYEFDLRLPVGQRVVKLARSDGSPLGGGTFRLCTSNYRATGTGGYGRLGRSPVLWRGTVEMPELTARYIRKNSPLELPDNGSFRVIWGDGKAGKYGTI